MGKRGSTGTRAATGAVGAGHQGEASPPRNTHGLCRFYPAPRKPGEAARQAQPPEWPAQVPVGYPGTRVGKASMPGILQSAGTQPPEWPAQVPGWVPGHQGRQGMDAGDTAVSWHTATRVAGTGTGSGTRAPGQARHGCRGYCSQLVHSHQGSGWGLGLNALTQGKMP